MAVGHSIYQLDIWKAANWQPSKYLINFDYTVI
jgi:hypothetical protein